MDNVSLIILAIEQGQECTEQESAQIKGWLRDLRMVGDQHMEAKFQTLFPLEYEEYLPEMDTKI